MSLCDYLHDPEHISAAIDEGKESAAGFVINSIQRGAVSGALVILMYIENTVIVVCELHRV